MLRIASLAVATAALVSLAFGAVNARAAEKDIVDTAVAAGQFKTLPVPAEELTDPGLAADPAD